MVEAPRERLCSVYAHERRFDSHRKYPVAVVAVVDVAAVAVPDLEQSCNTQASLIAVKRKKLELGIFYLLNPFFKTLCTLLLFVYIHFA